MNARERIYVLGVVGVIGAAVLMRPEVKEPEIEYRYQPPVSRLGPVAAPRPDLADIEAMTHCNVRLSDAARVLYGAGNLYRWTETDLQARFTEKRPTGDPDLATYVGDAIEFQDEDGSWVRAIYECDFNAESGEIVDVRTVPRPQDEPRAPGPLCD